MDHFGKARDLVKGFKADAYLFGNGVLKDAGGIVAPCGKRVALVRGGFPGVEDHLSILRSSLAKAGVSVVAEIPGARPNTPREDVLRMVGQFQRANPDAIVSFGGGSTIDAVKAAEVLCALGGDLDDYFGVGLVTKRLQSSGKKLTPHVAIQSAAGSGAHLTKYANVTDLHTGQKKLIVDDAIVPPRAVFDFTVTHKAPPALTADGALDGLSHILEVFYGAVGKPYYARLRETVQVGIPLIVGHLPRAMGIADCGLQITDSGHGPNPKSEVQNPQLVSAREALCLATDLGAYAIMLGGTSGGHLTSFSLVDILSHGRACALMNPYYTVFFAPAIEEPLRTVGALFKEAGYIRQDLNSLHGRELGVAVAHGMFAFARAIGFPTKLSEVIGFTHAHVDRALTAAKNPQLKMKLENMPVPLTAAMIDEYMAPLLEAATVGDLTLIKNVLTKEKTAMRRLKTTIVLGILLMTTLICSPTSAAVTFLRTSGQDMIDESGKKVLLRGVGLGNWLLPEGYMWQFQGQADRPRRIEKVINDLIGSENAVRFWAAFRKNYITEADVARIAELGFNSVRPALNARLFLAEGDNGTYLDEGFQLLDNLVAWCRKHDVYVIIDMHAAPGGQTGQNIDDSADDQPNLFIDRKNQDRLVDLWVKIAGRYKDEPAVAGFDLLNEPLPARTGAAGKYKDQLEPLYKRITAAIRQVDKRHMITLEGFDWANDWSAFSTPFDSNLFYQFHFYCWDKPTKLNDISKYLDYRKRLNAPVWVGETGEKDATIYWATTQYFETCNIGWSLWPWKKMETTNTPYSIKTPEGWNAIRAYTRGGAKPSTEAAQKAFDQLIENVKLQNCVYCPDVVNAVFHRVPGRVEAENYGHDGPNQSYFVNGTTQNSKYYRISEPVAVEPVDGGQGIRLSSREWTAYTIHSLSARDYSPVMRAKADGPAIVELSVNGHTEEVTLKDAEWKESSLKAMPFAQGANKLKFLVKSGVVSLDWIAFN